ncbi:hypothetical protein [Nocardiopsis sp. CA-288880]|uniref:hypothetical protein n=1 Tax=Nocardiopsis sp. CA-288880 TaxID=3239995 RepID=UPI003D977DE1
MSHVAGEFTGIIRDQIAALEEGGLQGDAPTVANISAADTAAVVTYINTVLLPALRDRGVIA